MKATLRAGVLGLADGLGANRRLLRSRWRGQRLLILCYHGFALSDEAQWDPELFISGQRFRQRLEYLRRNEFRVLSLEEGLARLREGLLPPRAVSITVDDGFYDFAAVGYPLLREFRYPATVYVSTYYVEHPWAVFDVMAGYLLWRAAAQGATNLRHDLLGEGAHPLRPAAGLRETAELLKTRARSRLGGEEKEALLGGIAAALGIDYAALRASRLLSLMRPEELQALDPELIDIQLHTHRHRVPEDRQLFLREIEENRAALQRAGRAPERLVHFCYPSGVHVPRFLPWLREAGMVSATTCDPGIASRQDDPLLLPRFIDTERTSDAEFAAWASGLRAVLNRRTFGL